MKVAMVQFTIPANKPLIQAINTGSEAETFRVKLLSIAQQVQASAMAVKPQKDDPFSCASG